MKILVLGASGFIGRRLIAKLSEVTGMEIIAASRSASTSAIKNCQTIDIDILNTQQLTAALAGVDAVVNGVLGNAISIRKGAQSLAKACQDQGVKTLVHLSSMAVYGSTIGTVTEDAPMKNDIGWYGHAKCDAELTLDSLSETGCRVVILRPGCVYSSSGDQWVGRIERLLKTKRIGDIGAAGDGFSNLVHVDDVVQAIIGALTKPSVQGKYNLSNPDSPDWNGYFATLAVQRGYTPVRRISSIQLKLDSLFISVGLKIVGILASKLKVKLNSLPDPLPPSLLRLWGQDIRLNSSRAATDLITQWTSLESGLMEE